MNNSKSEVWENPPALSASLPFTHKWRGIFWMLIWAISITIAVSFAKGLDTDTSWAVLTFLRFLFGLLFTIPFILSSGFPTLRTQHFPLHLLRVLFNMFSVVGAYFAYRHLPLAEATAIGFTEPLMTIVLAVIILRHKASAIQWMGTLVGYLGIFIIAQPEHIIINSAVYILLFANVCASISIICTKILSKTDSVFTTLTYTNILGVLLSGLIAIPYWKTPDMPNLWLMIGVGLFGVVSQFAYIKALQVETPSFLAPFEYTRLLMAIPIGILFFNELPSLQTLLGAGVIILTTYLLARSKEEKKA